MAQWNANTVPKCEERNCSDEVLVTWIPDWNKNLKRVSKAVYIPYHHCTIDDLGWSIPDNIDETDWTYSEENDSYWVPNGWWETIDNAIDDCNYTMIDGTVIAWSKLPKPYEPRLKDLALCRKEYYERD